jgi:hypothetical protein
MIFSGEIQTRAYEGKRYQQSMKTNQPRGKNEVEKET